MRKQIVKIAALSIGLLFSNTAIAKSNADILRENNMRVSYEAMVNILTEAKEAKIDRTDSQRKHKKYKENPGEPFSWWEEKIFKDFARTYTKSFTQNVVPNIDAQIARTDLDPVTKVGFLMDVESRYAEKAAISVWNDLILKRPDSKNARSAFCKVASETNGIKGGFVREKQGEICDKNFQLDPVKHFDWDVHQTPEVIKSIIIAPKLK